MVTQFLTAWVTWVTNRAALVMTVLMVLTVGAAYHAVTAFSMNSDTSRLIRQDTEWKRVNTHFVNAFPQYDQNTFVVVSGIKPNQVSEVTRHLAVTLRAKQDVFRTVYSPASNEFVDRPRTSLSRTRYAERHPIEARGCPTFLNCR